MVVVDAAERGGVGACEHGVQHVRLLRAGEQQIAQAAHRFLHDHGTHRAHMLGVHLDEAVGGALQRRTVLVRDDRRGVHDVVEHSGPPCEPQFVAHSIHRHMAVVQVGDELTEAGGVKFTLQAATLGQCVERLAVVEQRLEALLDHVEVGGLQITAFGRGGEHGVERRHVAQQRLLRGHNVVELRRQHGPAAVRHEQAPLLGLLLHDYERIVQVFDMRADAQHALRLFNLAAAVPEAHGLAFGFALGLGRGGFDHRVDVAFEDLGLEHVEHTAQVLEHRDLLGPLLRGCGNREAARLHGRLHLLARGGQQVAQHVHNTLVGVDRLVFRIQRGLVPCGVVGADRVFVQFAGAFELARPVVERRTDGARHLFAQTHMGGRVCGQFGDVGQVLDGLVGGHVPRLVHPMQVAEIAGEARAHAHKLVGQLVEARGGHALLVAHRADQLVVDRGVGVLVGHVEQLAA